jgi:hypothetical protein
MQSMRLGRDTSGEGMGLALFKEQVLVDSLQDGPGIRDLMRHKITGAPKKPASS